MRARRRLRPLEPNLWARNGLRLEIAAGKIHYVNLQLIQTRVNCYQAEGYQFRGRFPPAYVNGRRGISTISTMQG